MIGSEDQSLSEDWYEASMKSLCGFEVTDPNHYSSVNALNKYAFNRVSNQILLWLSAPVLTNF